MEIRNTLRISNKYQEFLLYLAVVLFGVAGIHSTMTMNFLKMAVWWSIALTLLVLISTTTTIVLIFLLTFTGEQFTRLGLIPYTFPDILLAALLLTLFFKALFLKAIKGEKIEVFGLWPTASFLLICTISALINGTEFLRLILFVRHVFQFYIFFIALQNLNLREETLKKINIFLFALFVVQIPTAIFKWFHYGVYASSFEFGGEQVGGTYGKGGSMGTVLPIFAIGFLFPMYVWMRKKAYLFLTFGFIFFSFLGGKKAFPYIFPVFILYLFYFMRSPKFKFSIHKKYVFAGIVIAAITLIGGAMLHPRLNPSHEVGGAFNPKHLIEFLVTYTTGRTEWWQEAAGTMSIPLAEAYTTGRVGSTYQVISVLAKEGISSILLGKGPGKFIESGIVKSTFKEGFIKVFRIMYGVTGLVWMFAHVGLLGVFCYLLLLWKFFKKIISIYRSNLDMYWRVFAIGVIGALFVITFDFLAYSTSFIAGKPLPSVVYYVMAALMIVSSREKIANIATSNRSAQKN